MVAEERIWTMARVLACVCAVVIAAGVGTAADGDELTFAIADQLSGGTVFLNGGTAFYSPTGNFSGADSFTITAGEGVSISAVATVYLWRR